MALDLRAKTTLSYTAKLTGNNSTVVEVLPPIQARTISFSSNVGIVYVYAEDTLSDGDTPAGTEGYQFIPLGNMLPLKIGIGSSRRNSFFVKFKTLATGTINIILEGE